MKAELQIFVHFIYKEYKYKIIVKYDDVVMKIIRDIRYLIRLNILIVSFVSINVLITRVLYLLHYVLEQNLSKFCQFFFFFFCFPMKER